MPSYPASVKSFTTKNTGDVIANTHVNDLQDEVNAIEAGLLNGTANLNSSGSTVTSLSVVNGSTLNTLQVAGSTFSVRPITPPPHAALVFLQSTAAIGSSVLSTLSFLSEDFLTNSSMHSTATNPERLTPQSTGIYMVSAEFNLAGAPAAASALQLLFRDSSNILMGAQSAQGVTLAGHVINATAYKRFDVTGGWVTCIFSNNGGASTHSLSSGTGGTWFAMVKL